jgi:hypothetical protein
MNYKLINDEEHLRYFIEHLTDDNNEGRYYVTLFARKKYDPSGLIKSDRAQLKRVVAKKKDIISKIRQMEIAVGAYEIDGNPVPQDSLAVYITPNVRSLKKAKRLLMKMLIDKIDDDSVNPQSLAMNALQQSCSGDRQWFDIDVDFTPEYLHKVDDAIKTLGYLLKNAFDTVRTRGGFHCLVKLNDPNLPKNWHKLVSTLDLDYCETMMIGSKPEDDKPGKDGLLPVPGCTQGGYTPRFHGSNDIL